MSVLVFGKHGQLARALGSANWGPETPVAFLGRGECDLLTVDPRDLESWMDRTQCQIVINAAGYTAVDLAEDEPAAAFSLNRDAPIALATACAVRNVPLIHVSTDYVFNGRKASPYVEDDPIDPLSVYGESKAAGEQGIRDRIGEHLIIRTSGLYGPTGSNFVIKILELARQGRVVRVVDDQRTAPTAASNLADAIIAVSAIWLAQGHVSWGTYHFAAQGDTTWYGFAAEILRLAASLGLKTSAELHPVSTADFGAKALRPANAVLDCTLIERTFGLKAAAWPVALEACVRDLITRNAPHSGDA